MSTLQRDFTLSTSCARAASSFALWSASILDSSSALPFADIISSALDSSSNRAATVVTAEATFDGADGFRAFTLTARAVKSFALSAGLIPIASWVPLLRLPRARALLQNAAGAADPDADEDFLL